MSADDLKKSINDAEFKRIVKEAIREWLDAQFAAFGKWSAIGIASATLGLLAYFLLTSSGWHK
jgi:hypothetical protein